MKKCIGVVSRFDYYDFFRALLDKVYTHLFKDSPCQNETLSFYLNNYGFDTLTHIKGVTSLQLDGVKLKLPDQKDLPYANRSHYQMLME